MLWRIHSRSNVTWFGQPFIEKRKYWKENWLFLENYRINLDLSRFCKGLSLVELVDHRFMINLIMSNIIANYTYIGKQAFLSHSLWFICDIHEVFLKSYFSLNFSFLLWFLLKKRKVKNVIWDDKKTLSSCFLGSLSLSQLAIFSQLEQYYAVLEQRFSPTVMNKLKMIRNDLNY